MRAISFIFIFIFSISNLSGLDTKASKEVFKQANSALESKKYDEALELYESLLDEYESAQLLHNYSLANYYNGRLAKAILYMEKANRIAPMNRNISKNLNLLKENVDSEVVKVPNFFLKSWLNYVSKLTTSSIWLILHIIVLGFAITLFYFYLIKEIDFNLHFYYIRGVIISLFVISLLLAGLSYNRNFIKNNSSIAIVMKDQVPLRMGAEANSQEIMKVNQGVKVKIEDEIGDFYKVKLEDYTESWVKKEFVEII